MTSRPTASMVQMAVLRRLHPIQRIGWITARRSSTFGRTALGVALFGIGTIAKRQSRRKVLYRQVLTPGESVRIKVFSGDTLIGDSTVGS